MSIRALTNPEAGDARLNVTCKQLNYTTLNPPVPPPADALTDTIDGGFLSNGRIIIATGSGLEVQQSNATIVSDQINVPTGGEYQIAGAPVVGKVGSEIIFGNTTTSTVSYIQHSVRSQLNPYSMRVVADTSGICTLYALNDNTPLDIYLGLSGGPAQNVRLNTGSAIYIDSTEVLNKTALSSSVANASITNNTAATLTNSGNINITTGSYRIGNAIKLSATQLNDQNVFPNTAGQIDTRRENRYVFNQAMTGTTASISSQNYAMYSPYTVSSTVVVVNAISSLNNYTATLEIYENGVVVRTAATALIQGAVRRLNFTFASLAMSDTAGYTLVFSLSTDPNTDVFIVYDAFLVDA